MVNKQLSYDFQNTIRDMSEVFSEVVKRNPITSAILTVSNETFRNTKMEWLEDVKAPLSWTMDQDHTASDGEIDISATAGLETGMIVQFDHVTTGARSTLIAKVGTVTTDDKFAITVYGGSTDENIASGSTVRLISKPKNEATDPDASAGAEPTAKYNYTQIFDRTAKVSKTAMSTEMYGINKNLGDVLDYQVKNKMTEIAYEVGATTINMPRVQRGSGEAGTMGGWFWFMKQASGNSVNASGANVSALLLNQAFEAARTNGGMPTTIVAHPVQAKFLSALNANGTVIIARDEVTAGQYVKNFVTDFGDQATIVYTYDMDQDKIAIITPSLIKMRPMADRAFKDMDATLP